MSPRVRQAIYLALSLLGAASTWWNNLAWMRERGDDATLARFWLDAFASPVSSSLAWDILVAGSAAWIFVIVESRRLGIRYWPVLYIILANGIAAAFAFPLFLFVRERRLQAVAAATGG